MATSATQPRALFVGFVVATIAVVLLIVASILALRTSQDKLIAAPATSVQTLPASATTAY